jgi:WD40 repeat protein
MAVPAPNYGPSGRLGKMKKSRLWFLYSYLIDGKFIVLGSASYRYYFLDNNNVINEVKGSYENGKALQKSSLSSDMKFISLIFKDKSSAIFDVQKRDIFHSFSSRKVKNLDFSDDVGILIASSRDEIVLYKFERLSNLSGKRKLGDEIKRAKKMTKLG